MTTTDAGTNLPQLPLEVLSVIACLVVPPHGPPPNEIPRPAPHASVVPLIDPHPHPEVSPTHALSLVSRSAHCLLEASRPWLWENVDVRSGRGWLAIVNALMEEIAGDEDGGETSAGMQGNQTQSASGVSGSSASASQQQQVAPVEAMRQPSIMNPSGGARYAYPASSASSAFALTIAPAGSHPQGSSIGSGSATSAPQMPLTPPQPPSVSLLLSPPAPSRNISPQFILPESPPRPVPSLPSGPRLRGRSRSRSRSKSRSRVIDFDTGGSNAALLARARSVSAHRSPGGNGDRDGSWPRRIPLERRRSSLSRVRTREEVEDVVHDEEDEDAENDADNEEDGGMVETLEEALKGNTLERITSIFSDGAGEGALRAKLDEDLPENDEDGEENWLNVNPELLPPPGPYIRHLNFSNFRTIGSRRTQEEAVRGRFVTAGRLEGVIKNTPNLVTLCMTEYVDSALSLEVLEELLFRGTRRPRMPTRRMSSAYRSLSRARSQSIDPNGIGNEPPTAAAPNSTHHDQLEPPRPEYVPYEIENEEEMWKRRSVFTAMQALDLTGCVSRNFTEAMQDFWEKWFAPEEVLQEEEEERGRGRGRGRRRHGPGTGDMSTHETDTEMEDESMTASIRSSASSRRRAPAFPHLRRLSLRACLTLDSHRLDSLLLGFPNLTHLDLSNTKVSSAFLLHLLERPPRGMRLKSLSLARCSKIEPYVLVDFLVRCSVAEDLVELNLFVNPSQGRIIRSDDLMRLITTAPCFKKGQLRYLDMSSAQFTAEHLAVGVFPPQPCLMSLGLSYMPTLPLPPIADFILNLAPNVEILTLIGTAHETALRPSNPSLQITLELHARLINPLTTVPFSLSSLNMSGNTAEKPVHPNPGPTRLRVVELSAPIRRAIGPEGGSNEWKLIKSKGGRGWLVDVSAGWVKDTQPDGVQWRFARHMSKDQPSRKWLMSLSEANGRVGSWVGWHSRKMEVIKGYGMCGREEGMAGAGAFAFEE